MTLWQRVCGVPNGAAQLGVLVDAVAPIGIMGRSAARPELWRFELFLSGRRPTPTLQFGPRRGRPVKNFTYQGA